MAAISPARPWCSRVFPALRPSGRDHRSVRYRFRRHPTRHLGHGTGAAALPIARLQDQHVRIGGLDAAVAYAGLISPGVYQFNVVVPQVGAGDQSVVAELRGLLTQSNLLLTVQP